MDIVSFSAIKGGVGKTTLAFNFGEWLANNGKKVLFIDLDHQCNLSQIYDIYDNEGTVGNIFKDLGKVKIHSVSENVSLIAGDMRLDDIERDIENKTNKNMLLYLWLSDNYERLNLEQFDYIILDTHPDFSTATKNALIISNSIISPLTPSEHGYNAKFNLEERIKDLKDEAIDYSTRESYFTANLYYVANMVKHNTKSSRELLEAIKDENNILAIIPEKEIFNRTTLDKKSVSAFESDHKIYTKHKKFFDEISDSFNKISTTI
ncbi:ParA family protein [Lactococcus garvieae]|uniref:ParA family protein n=1 Tax=Lactococcus garvieae TaxID=1363 RepID=UPI0038537F98